MKFLHFLLFQCIMTMIHASGPVKRPRVLPPMFLPTYGKRAFLHWDGSGSSDEPYLVEQEDRQIRSSESQAAPNPYPLPPFYMRKGGNYIRVARRPPTTLPIMKRSHLFDEELEETEEDGYQRQARRPPSTLPVMKRRPPTTLPIMRRRPPTTLPVMKREYVIAIEPIPVDDQGEIVEDYNSVTSTNKRDIEYAKSTEIEDGEPLERVGRLIPFQRFGRRPPTTLPIMRRRPPSTLPIMKRRPPTTLPIMRRRPPTTLPIMKRSFYLIDYDVEPFEKRSDEYPIDYESEYDPPIPLRYDRAEPPNSLPLLKRQRISSLEMGLDDFDEPIYRYVRRPPTTLPIMKRRPPTTLPIMKRRPPTTLPIMKRARESLWENKEFFPEDQIERLLTQKRRPPMSLPPMKRHQYDFPYMPSVKRSYLSDLYLADQLDEEEPFKK